MEVWSPPSLRAFAYVLNKASRKAIRRALDGAMHCIVGIIRVVVSVMNKELGIMVCLLWLR